MQHINENKELKHIAKKVIEIAKEKFNREIPDIEFIVLNNEEFRSLLQKRVYPTSPVNIWEGKRVLKDRHTDEAGENSALYYEVVQTGRPSYAYLNYTNSATTQASVMAHVVGHCEFSELNVLNDSDDNRTEFVMWLVNKIKDHVPRMGFSNYMKYWNWSESVVPLISPNSQYNLENSVETNKMGKDLEEEMSKDKEEKPELFSLVDPTLDKLLINKSSDEVMKDEEDLRDKTENIDRKGFNLKAPCQDILGFLKEFAPTSKGEKYILEYHYAVNKHNDFVVRTQIMNEGWAMYWEKKIMTEMFKQGVVKDVIDYCKVASGVMYPRPYFQRNPYHLGFYMWTHIEELFKKGKDSLEYLEEVDVEKKKNWNEESDADPMKKMEEVLRTCTDYEFLRRFLTPDLIEKFHLNRIDHRTAQRLNIGYDQIAKEDERYIWISTEGIKEQMLSFFTDFYRPMLYIIDSDYREGGLLIYHRHKGRNLKKSWISPTLRNITKIWKSPAHIISNDVLYSYSDTGMTETSVEPIEFDLIRERMADNIKPVNN